MEKEFNYDKAIATVVVDETYKHPFFKVADLQKHLESMEVVISKKDIKYIWNYALLSTMPDRLIYHHIYVTENNIEIDPKLRHQIDLVIRKNRRIYNRITNFLDMDFAKKTRELNRQLTLDEKRSMIHDKIDKIALTPYTRWRIESYADEIEEVSI